MASAARVVHSPTLPTLAVFKAHGDDTSTAVLTYPIFDADGEWLQPDGGDWSKYPLRPNVNWHHRTPVGRGEVTLKAIEVKGENWVVPVGTTKFFKQDSDLNGIDLRIPDLKTGLPTNKSYSREECLSRAAEVGYLVTSDRMTGISIEFFPNEGKVIGKSLSKPGKYACAYSSWRGRGWAHVFDGQQVNPGAQTVAKAHELRDLILGGKRPDGEPFSDVIRKAFENTGPTTVRVVGDVPREPTMNPTTMGDAGHFTPPEAAKAYEWAQIKSDIAGELEDVAGRTLCPVTKAFYLAQANVERTGAEDLIAQAQDLEARVGGQPVEKALHYDADGFPASHDVKLEAGEDGALVLKSRYVPRLRLADLKPVEQPDLSPSAAEEFDRIYREALQTATRPTRRIRN